MENVQLIYVLNMHVRHINDVHVKMENSVYLLRPRFSLVY